MNSKNDLICRVNDLLGSDTFLSIKDSLQVSSLFSMVGTTHLERWHSAFTAWLLNPDCNHALEAFPLRRFLAAARVLAFDLHEIGGLPDLGEIEAAEFCEHSVMPNPTSGQGRGEKTVKVGSTKCSFDVALTAMYKSKSGGNDPKLLLIIENKIKAHESSDQTKLYADWAWDTPVYPIADGDDAGGEGIDYRVLVFLTPWRKGKHSTPKDPRFIPMNYQSFYDMVLKPCLAHPKLSERGGLLINEYVDSLVDAGYILTQREQLFWRVWTLITWTLIT